MNDRLGGQIQQHDAPRETMVPGWFFDPVSGDPALAPELGPLDAQNQDLDWGDGREVKVTWRPGSGPWTVSGAVRFGRTNGAGQVHAAIPEGRNCKVAQYICELYFPTFGEFVYFEGPNGVLATAVDREEHTLIDFAIGRDFGFGGLKSTLEAGVRHAEFESRSVSDIDGIDWEIPDEFAQLSTLFADRYLAHTLSERSFEGYGPVVSWDASLPLLGNEQTGHANLDWSIEGGVLFGKQEATVQGEEEVLYQTDPKYGGFGQPNLIPLGDPVVTTLDIAPRSEDVTVTTFGASLGLSYDIQRIKIGAGYRWERYFDVLDVGFDEAKDADRTIDGPYFKLSVGFGG